MRIRTLLLGTAAAFAVGGTAQAADLAVAVEPIDYVKVCDAFGTGYYYIPGSDTCLKIAGKVQLDAWVYDSSKVTDTSGYGPTGYTYDSYSSSWEFKSEAAVNFTAKTMSDMGPVVTYFAFVTNSNNSDWKGAVKGEKMVRWDGGYGAIGPLLFGWTGSTFDPSGGFTYDGAKRSDTKTDQLRFSYMMGTWGIMLGLEDPRDRWGGMATGDMPDIILALTGGAGGLDWKLSAGVADLTVGTAWGANLQATIDLGGGAKLRGNIAYADNGGSFTGSANGSGASWSAFLSAIVALSGNVNAAATVSYVDHAPGAGGGTEWVGAIGAYWAATATSEIGLEVLYTDHSVSGDSLGVHGRFKTTFNGG